MNQESSSIAAGSALSIIIPRKLAPGSSTASHRRAHRIKFVCFRCNRKMASRWLDEVGGVDAVDALHSPHRALRPAHLLHRRFRFFAPNLDLSGNPQRIEKCRIEGLIDSPLTHGRTNWMFVGQPI